MLNGRLPWSNRPTAGAVSQRTGAVYGDHSVRFNDDGRPLYPGMQKGRPNNGNLLFWRRDRELMEPELDVGPVDTFRYRPYRTVTVSQQRPDLVRAAPFITRRSDAPQSYETTATVTTMRPEVVVVEEMKIYDEKPCAWWLFIILGILTLIMGVLNIIWCWQYHWFCRFWAGVLLLIFGVSGALHRGDYIEVKLRSLSYIVLGMVTTLAVMAASAAVLDTLAHQVIEISQYGYPDYLTIQQFRYQYAQQSPLSNLTNWDYNIAVCLGLDSLQFLVTLVAFTVLASTLYIVDRYFNSHYVIRRKVEPFCEPWLFNPWGQCNLGQAQILIGLVLLNSVHGTLEYPWQKTGAPIWAGIIPVFAGIVAALSLKACDRKRRLLNFVAVVLEIVSIIGSIVAIVLVTLGIADNIRTLRNNPNYNSMNRTDWPIQMMVASSVLFAISDLSCIINVFYSLSLLYRIFSCIWSKKEEDDEFRFIDERSEVIVDDRFKYTDTEYPPAPTRFDPFRPAATRSFYVR